MSGHKKAYTRRDFFKTAGVAGLGSALLTLSSNTKAHGSAKGSDTDLTVIPTRPFGNTGVDVSILSLGGVLDAHDQLVFKQALNMGVTYWDTADSYAWGKNEKAIGKYFAKYPGDRKKVFLVTKAAASDPRKLTQKLNTSLKRMNTSYVDMFLIHYVNDVKDEMTDAVKDWAEAAKAEGKIRLIGFSTHKNMENCMLAAAQLGWIDGIMMSYNFRLMITDNMKAAVAACVEAGIGLTAMKTQAAFSANFYSDIGSKTDAAVKMTEKFLEKGFTAEQAKLKVVWDNPHIASICSAMPNMTILQANVAAALNKNQLSAADKIRLDTYAQQTAPGYCAGCAHICEPALDGKVPVSDILRYAMYHHGYGDKETASQLFNRLTPAVKTHILTADYTEAENRCPQNIPIGTVLRQTYRELV